MFSWLSKKEETLKPLPLSQREKTYSSASGVVYQYIFKGMAGRAHVFSVSHDRRNSYEVRVELSEDGQAGCAELMGGELRWNEQYALAKLCLFAAFDAEVLERNIVASREELLEHMRTLNMV
ncbi:MAG: hypothetical protein FJW36_13245 [Acidobacteria bacterium]|nr:hypothetical protein [Acidobacteriota bacterium]